MNITEFDLASVYGDSIDDVLSFLEGKSNEEVVKTWMYHFGRDLIRVNVPREDLFKWATSFYNMFAKASGKGFTPIRIVSGSHNTAKSPDRKDSK